MKFKEAIEKIDKSKNNEEYVDIEKIAEALSMDFYQNPEQERLKSYWLTCWLCTDTWVGSRIYFLDDEAVCWSFQGGRKSDEEFSWFSKEAAEKTREYILSLKEEEDLNVDLTSIDDEIGETYKINFNSQVLDWKKALYQGKSFEFIWFFRLGKKLYRQEDAHLYGALAP